MSILVLGNGFDIAHDLPTSYKDFLRFIEVFRGRKIEDSEHLSTFVDKYRSENSERSKEVADLLRRENGLLEYFLSVYKDRCEKGRDGWIDFEKEISHIIMLLEEVRQKESEAKSSGNDKFIPGKKIIEELVKVKSIHLESPDGGYKKRFSIGYFEGTTELLLQELNIITRLLEIYLIDYVESIKVCRQIREIVELTNVTKIINFNYTDTYRKIYNKM